MRTLFCYCCLFCPINILLHTLNSALYFVLFRTEDDRRTVQTSFFNFKSVVHFPKFVTYLLLSRPFDIIIWLRNVLTTGRAHFQEMKN